MLLSMAEWHSIVYMYNNFFTYSFVDGHLGCFHVQAIGNSDAMNTGVHTPFWITIFSRHMPRQVSTRIAGPYGSFIPNFLRISMPFSIVAVCNEHWGTFVFWITVYSGHMPMCPFNSTSLTVFNTSYKGIHAGFVLLCLAYFSWHNVFQVDPCCLMTGFPSF